MSEQKLQKLTTTLSKLKLCRSKIRVVSGDEKKI